MVDLGRVKGGGANVCMAASNVYLQHNCMSQSNDCAAVAYNNNQAQLHTRVSVLY